MLSSLSIKTKMLLFSILMTLGIVVLSLILGSGIKSLMQLEEARALSIEANSLMKNLRIDEKDFLSRQDLQYLTSFNENYNLSKTQISDLERQLKAHDIELNQLLELSNLLEQYQIIFNEIVSIKQIIGLTPTEGLYGSLRRSVHGVEQKVEELQNDTLLKDMLMLRRNEKDFMLRRDTKYIDTFNTNLAIFYQDLQQSYLSESDIREINSLMQNYSDTFIKLVNAEEQFGLNETAGKLGEMRLIVHHTHELFESTTEQILNEVRSHEKSTYVSVFISIAVILPIIFFLSQLISRSVVYPINILAEVMKRAQQNKDLTERVSLEGKNEIVQMADVFNQMMTAFSQLIQQVFDSSQQLNVAAEELTVITGQTSRGVMSQQSDSEQVATAMNEMAATVQEVARYAAEAAEASQTADDETRAGKQVVLDAIDGIKQLARQVEAGAISIKDLQKESENIGSVLSVIQGIAEQTNLLALNAAIEAARAGESGRGFAVVADEVRTLAQRSHDSTEEIKKIIQRLQSEAEKAVNVMDEELVQANQSVEKAEKAGQSLDKIAQSVTSIRDMNTHIASAAEEQSAVAEEINRNIVSIAQVAEENAESTGQTTLTSEELARLANGLEEQISQFKI